MTLMFHCGRWVGKQTDIHICRHAGRQTHKHTDDRQADGRKECILQVYLSHSPSNTERKVRSDVLEYTYLRRKIQLIIIVY